jgi:hypothetical protein
MQRVSYFAPLALVGLLAWAGKPSWWAVAMLTGGARFAWDYLWGDRRVLDATYGLKLTAIGAMAVAAALGLAMGLGMSLTDFQATARGLPRREAFLYHLPSTGIGIALYGLLVWSRAWSRERED